MGNFSSRSNSGLRESNHSRRLLRRKLRRNRKPASPKLGAAAEEERTGDMMETFLPLLVGYGADSFNLGTEAANTADVAGRRGLRRGNLKAQTPNFRFAVQK